MDVRWKVAQYCELKWWKRYLGEKNKALYLANKKKYWTRLYSLISDKVKIGNNDIILDQGCGPSGIYMLFDDNKVTATDPLLDEYEKYLDIFSKTDYPNTTFIRTKIEDFDGNEAYDVVFCMNAINHVSDIELAYKKLISCARKRGRIVVSIDAHNHRIFKYLFRMVPGDILHPHQYDLKEYNFFMEKNNCKILQTERVKKGFFFNHYMTVAEKQV